MKTLFFLLLLPLTFFGQTVHVKKKEIVYKGSVSPVTLPASESTIFLTNAINTAIKKSNAKAEVQTNGNNTVAAGKMRLHAPFHIVRTLHFTFQLSAKSNGYEYQVDSVFVTERRRGSEENRIPTKDLLDNMEETGNVAIETERILNEIDLRLQKLIAVVESELKRK